MNQVRPPTTRKFILAITFMIITTSSCANGSAMNSSPLTMSEARASLIDLVHQFFQGSLDKLESAQENRPACSSTGRPNGLYRWDYFTSLRFSPEAEVVARRVVGELRNKGWMIEEEKRKQLDDTNFTASKEGEPLLSITIPGSAFLLSGTPRTIRGGGSSKCIEDNNPPEPRGLILPPVISSR